MDARAILRMPLTENNIAMASKNLHSTFFIGVILVLNLALAPAPSTASAVQPVLSNETELTRFTRRVTNGEETVTGVYVLNRFFFPVVQQPEGDPGFVSPKDNIVTEFGTVASQNNIGLLAHNYLAGRRFSELAIGDRIYLIYGTGRMETFVVTTILRYQALDPVSPYSDFRTLDGTQTLSSTEMFNRAYTGPRHLTFQTCLERDGNSSWGRLFVIAEPE